MKTIRTHYVKLLDDWNIKFQMCGDLLVKSEFTKTFEEIFECHEVAEQVIDYLDGRRNLPDVDIEYSGTKFQNKVWAAIKDIEYGKTSSYKEIAMTMFEKGGFQAVGSACNKNIYAPFVPCHRVVGKNKDLFAVDSKIKNYLLSIENKK